MNKSDKHWEKFGADDPYYWVTTLDKYRGNIDKSKVIKEFFDEGENYINNVIEIVKQRLDTNFNPESFLDFGCGVGRVLVPIAKKCSFAYGIDISSTMLERAQYHANKEKLSNITLLQNMNTLQDNSIKFDFIHSNYVFQHIRINQGIKLFKKLLSLLSKNGVAVLQFTYANELSQISRVKDWFKLHVPGALPLMNIIKGNKANAPMMEMYNYPLNEVVQILHSMSVDHYYIRHTKDGPFKGALLFIQPNNSETNFINLGDIP